MVNLLQKLISDQAFYITITDADIGSLSIHYLISIHAGEIWTKSYGTKYTKFEAFWQKWLTIFLESVDVILEGISMT